MPLVTSWRRRVRNSLKVPSGNFPAFIAGSYINCGCPAQALRQIRAYYIHKVWLSRSGGKSEMTSSLTSSADVSGSLRTSRVYLQRERLAYREVGGLAREACGWLPPCPHWDPLRQAPQHQGPPCLRQTRLRSGRLLPR